MLKRKRKRQGNLNKRDLTMLLKKIFELIFKVVSKV